MESDLRSTLRRLAPSPARHPDFNKLQQEGSRRRRVRYVAFATAITTGVVGSILGLGALSRDRTQTPDEDGRPARPVESPTTPGPADPWNDLRTGWTKMPSPPQARTTAATAWTGRGLIIWGGYVYTGFSDEAVEGDGFSFNAATRTWSSIAPSPLAARAAPASAWTGSELLIWGGGRDTEFTSFFADGAAYDPVTDTWRSLPEAPISARAPLSVWTGQEFIVWGSSVGDGHGEVDGAAYDPSENSWRPLSQSPATLSRATALWTGEEMIIVGDSQAEDEAAETTAALAYNPATDTWRPPPDAPLAEEATTAAWNGEAVIGWDYENQTAAYDPAADKWRQLGQTPLRDYECGPQSVAVDRSVFGDYCGAMVVFDPRSETWRDITRDELAGWGFDLVAAPPAALVFGRDVETGKEAMYAYRPR